MTVKSFVRFVVLTLLCIVIFTMMATWLFQVAVSHSTQRFSRVLAGELDVDILVAGNSRAVNLLTGDESAPAVFNLGYNSLYRADTFALIKDYFAAGNTAAVTLIEVTALVGKDLPYCRLKPYWSQLPHLRDAARKGCPQQFAQGRIFPLLNFNSEVFLRALHYLLIKRQGDQDWINDYVLNDRKCAAPPIQVLGSLQSKFLEESGLSLQADLQGLDSWLKRQKIETRIVLVLAPFLFVEQTRKSVTDIQTAANELFSDSNYVDLATAISQGCSGFADTVHMSRLGMAQLRKQIVSKVQAFQSD